jgi:hypothetical protein
MKARRVTARLLQQRSADAMFFVLTALVAILTTLSGMSFFSFEIWIFVETILW